jgi:UPF0755 protein
MKGKRKIYIALGGSIVLLFIFVLSYAHYFGPVDRYAGNTEFIVTPGESSDRVASDLKKEGFIRSSTAFRIGLKRSLKNQVVRPGGYELSASMDVWTIANNLAKPPYLVFFTFPPGWRKEQIAEKLATTFDWTPAMKSAWINVDTAPSPSFVEGVYYPDTYLIPSDQSPLQIAQRFRDRFQQEFTPYATEAQQKNIPWPEVVTLASMLEREAAGSQDMPLIAGIMWNRLNAGMSLQIDATLQYITGTESNWWPVPTVADKSIKSPFNTYLHKGVPPHAISNPGLGAINDILNPEKTDCIYYLHDPNRQIHCSKTYAGQLANVNKYLK